MADHLLLETKLFPPSQTSDLVLRPRLTARITAGMSRRLTLISAPAGFGKTTLIGEWLSEFGENFSLAWLSLDGDDNDAERFLSYCLATLDRAKPGLAANLGSLSASRPAISTKTILAALINDLAAADGQIVLALDDYHFITSPAIHELLTYLLDHLPPQLHLVILTRSDPPLPLARLRSRDQIIELRIDDLSFTLEEAAEFMQRIAGLSLSPQNLLALESRTEGWVTGLKLAALSMRGRQDLDQFIADFTGSNRYILDYLVEEVLGRQPAHIQQFLLRTSILERLNSSLCEAVLGVENSPTLLEAGKSQQALEYLERANLFLIPLDDQRGWYRCHHLFADLLRSRLQHTSPELIPELHGRASGWYERHGFPVEATRHAFNAEDYPRAADLIAAHGQARWALSDTEYLQMAGRLPLELLQIRPNLGIYHAWYLIIYGQYQASESLLRLMLQNILQSEAIGEIKEIQGFIELLLIYIEEITGDHEYTHLPPPQVLDIVPEHHLGMRNSADVIYAQLLYLRADFEAAAEILLNAVRRDLAAGGTTAVPIAISRLAQMHILQGRLREAADLCREHIQYVQERGAERFYIAGNLNAVLGEILRQWNQLERAEDQIQAGLVNNKNWNVPHAQVVCYTALARLQLSQGKPDEALASVEKLEEMIRGKTTPAEMLATVEALRVRLWLARGEVAAARAWAQKHTSHAAVNFRRELDWLSVGRVYLAAGQPEQALELLEQLARLAEAQGRKGRLLEIRLLQAIAWQGLKRIPQAVQAIAAGLALAEPEGVVRLFLDEGPVIKDLLGAYLRSGATAHSAYARTLLSAFSSPGQPPGALAAGLIEPLTRREREVLELICAGLSNHAIAEKLVITLSAVKKHTGNIYGKLGVQSRTQAIARARQLDLIPSGK